jgi:hypothetical protein
VASWFSQERCQNLLIAWRGWATPNSGTNRQVLAIGRMFSRLVAERSSCLSIAIYLAVAAASFGGRRPRVTCSGPDRCGTPVWRLGCAKLWTQVPVGQHHPIAQGARELRAPGNNALSHVPATAEILHVLMFEESFLFTI